MAETEIYETSIKPVARVCVGDKDSRTFELLSFGSGAAGGGVRRLPPGRFLQIGGTLSRGGLQLETAGSQPWGRGEA